MFQSLDEIGGHVVGRMLTSETKTAEAVTERMRRVRREGTAPEMQVRRFLHALGYRYRLHDPKLPGRPDVVFRRWRKAIFVHGCFWHRHGCSRATTPVNNRAYWEGKFGRNIRRDQTNQDELRAMDWHVLIVWECEMKDREALAAKLTNFLGFPRAIGEKSRPELQRCECPK